METHRVQEHLKGVHHKQHAHHSEHEAESQDKEVDGGSDASHGLETQGSLELSKEDRQENFTELSVSQRKGPKTQVRGSVGNTSEDKFDSLNDLMDEDLANTIVVILLGGMLLEHLLNVTDVTVSHKTIVVFTDQGVLLIVVILLVSGHGLKLVIMGIVLGTAAESDARNGAKHDGKEEEGDVDKNVGGILLSFNPLERFGVFGGEAGEAHDVTNDDDNDGW
jgi:hypothetical protein